MLRISEKDDEIIIRDIADTEFIPIFLGIFVISYLIFFGRNYLPLDFVFLIAAFGLLIFCIYKLSFIQTKTVKINKQKRILSINNRSLVKNISYVYRFGEIHDLIYVETLKDKDGNTSHKLVFPLETGERIALSRTVSTGVERYFEAADVVNYIIFNNPKKIPQNFTGFNKF